MRWPLRSSNSIVVDLVVVVVLVVAVVVEYMQWHLLIGCCFDGDS